LGQPGRVKSRVKWPRPCLADNVFAKEFFFLFEGVFGVWETPPYPCFENFIIKKNDFFPNKA